ncbi:cytochrome C biogenesis protein [Halobacteriales archaeon QS_5_70_15]|nr:MAG: cytochrome C biogenesis protein [Halobacteriales archaeon QS_5_70_15]
MVDVEGLRIGFAFAAGAATFFAPCAFPLLPGYVAYYLGQVDGSDSAPLAIRLRRAAIVGTLASLGFFVVYGALAGIVASLGAGALADIATLELGVGGLLILLGLAMASGRFDPSLHVQLPERERSAGGFFLFGVVYGVAAAGCTAPIFVGLALFALGSGPLGAAVAVGRAGLLRTLSRNTGRVSRVAGALLALAGVAQIYLFVFDFDWLGILRLV